MSSILSKSVDLALDEFDRKKKADSYFNDPASWAEYMLGVKLWSKQREIAESLLVNKDTAVKAGHGVGKSFLVAVLVCWWIDTRAPNVFVASTAPSTAQIGAIVWREIRKMYAEIGRRYKEGLIDHALPGYITADNQWKMAGGTILGFGRKPPENKEDDAFQGLHDGAVLAIGDEACGLTFDLIDALGNITSNAGSRRILIANPTNPASYFAKIFREDLGWSLHTISVLESPNFTDERFEMTADALSKLSDQTYVEGRKREYGEGTPRYMARVLGEFAFDVDNVLISPDDVEKGKSTEVRPSADTRPVLGVDVARMGEDKSCVYQYHDGQIRFIESWGKAATTETANRVHRIAVENAVRAVYVDSDGVGGGVKDQLVQLAEGLYLVIEVHGSANSPDRRQWHNFRAYAWDKFRLGLHLKKFDLDPEDITLQDELVSVQYKYNSQSGGLQIESKEDMKDRGFKSPDNADAAIYASIDDLFFDEDPLANMKPGDKIRADPETMLDDFPGYLQLMGVI